MLTCWDTLMIGQIITFVFNTKKINKAAAEELFILNSGTKYETQYISRLSLALDWIRFQSKTKMPLLKTKNKNFLI